MMIKIHYLLLVVLITNFYITDERKCRPTSSDVIGPFYFPDPPKLKGLCRYERTIKDDEDEVPLYVYGRVKSYDCKTPLRGVRVEVWQADHTGSYRNTSKCRGYIKTDKYGVYQFVTIYPGRYTASHYGDDYRPAHIHFKVFGPDGHKTLVTQMYFHDDIYLGEKDPCVGCSSHRNDLIVKKDRYCDFDNMKKDYCIDTVEFDINLSKGKGLHVSPPESIEDIIVC